MKHKTIFLILLLTLFPASFVFALDPMGPTTAELKQNQWSLGFDYSYTEMDMEFTDVSIGGTRIPGNITIDDIEQNKLYANVGYGIIRDWDVFVRVGASDIDLTDDVGDGMDSDFGFATGFGSKLTLYKQGKFSWGLLGQASYAEMDGFSDFSGTILGSTVTESDIDIDLWEFQFATGPTIKLDSHFTVYGGGFYHMIDGDYDSDVTIDGSPFDFKADIEEDSEWGGYGGIQINWDKRSRWNIEFQRTGAGYGIGTQVIVRF
ncbi:MAG: hypothetical protein ACYSR3_12800 [Planctomycetota bacterium]|jgi:hypothetical protein